MRLRCAAFGAADHCRKRTYSHHSYVAEWEWLCRSMRCTIGACCRSLQAGITPHALSVQTRLALSLHRSLSHTRAHVHTRTNIHTRAHTPTHTHAHAHTHACARARGLSDTQAQHTHAPSTAHARAFAHFRLAGECRLSLACCAEGRRCRCGSVADSHGSYEVFTWGNGECDLRLACPLPHSACARDCTELS